MSAAGGFVMVPDWWRRKRPSGLAVLAYINLGARGTWNPGTGTYDECRPKMKTLAEDMGVSESTAKRACDELVATGAATKSLRYNPDGSPAPSVYRLIFGQLVEPPAADNELVEVGSPVNLGGGFTGEPRVGSPTNPPGSTGEPRVGSPVTRITKNPLTKRKTPQPRASAGSADPDPPDQPPVVLRPCGREHADTLSCRPCGTNPRAKATAARVARRQPCPVPGHIGQLAASCSLCAGEAKAAVSTDVVSAPPPVPRQPWRQRVEASPS